MNKWDQRFIDLAAFIASWSKDTTKVGAVIVDDQKRVVSTGYNGFPRGTCDDELPRERKLLRVLHAESNAIDFAYRDITGCTLYVTHPPCAQCMARIIQTGITRVVFTGELKPDWGPSTEEARWMAAEAGITVERFETGA